MACAALLPSLITAQAGVDFQTKASALGPVLERLSGQTGTKLRASPAIAHDIVFRQARRASRYTT